MTRRGFKKALKSTIACPNCFQTNPSGSLVCVKCNTRFPEGDDAVTMGREPFQQSAFDDPTLVDITPVPRSIGGKGVISTKVGSSKADCWNGSRPMVTASSPSGKRVLHLTHTRLPAGFVWKQFGHAIVDFNAFLNPLRVMRNIRRAPSRRRSYRI